VVTLYGFLQRDGTIKTDWFAHQVALADRTDGDIDTLSTRIAHIRTWTFAANRPDWLGDPEHWQGVTRGVEDRLSDALHERLTERFVDRRTSVLMRRLRENATLEPDVNKTGDVVVEGHLIGRLDGFVFVPDAASGGSEAKALQNAAQKALAGEIAARAARLAEAPDTQFVLAADGTLRWTGAAVGKLYAGEEVLRPRIRIVADDHLNGAPRDAVETRLNAWVKTHIEKLLGPLSELAAAADVTGIARGVAFQLVEALGVLDRQRVAEEVKGLEQPARATLRKYGVRFGAYHIYIPALLKPAPRALATQLWMLMHNGPQEKLVDLLHLAGSGRTSIPIDREIDPTLYRTAGYRVCGERAVRVDILERLADLIRPALAWREGAPGARPRGAFPGGGFTVVNTMTSLTGASGEDFASILRSLGYRMERRPKPLEPPPEPPATAAPSPSEEIIRSHTSDGDAAGEAAMPTERADASLQIDPQLAEQTEIFSAENGDQAPAADVAEKSQEAAREIQEVPQETVQETGEATAQDTAQAASQEAAKETAQATAQETEQGTVEAAASASAPPPSGEPEMVEVWRPGRPEGRRRPRERHRGPARQPREFGKRAPKAAQDSAAPGAGVAAVLEASPPTSKTESAPAPDAHPDKGRPPRHRRHQEHHRSDRPRERPPAKRFEHREKAPDPNSPFAKLAALKAQLEADAKERR
jgi:ATP-dependent RNA helicase SUPV3L1/SUV3